jgi:hypothetical protein
MEEIQAEDEEDGMRKNKCIKLKDEKPLLPVAGNELWIEEQRCSMVTTTSESIRLPAGLERI